MFKITRKNHVSKLIITNTDIKNQIWKQRYREICSFSNGKHFVSAARASSHTNCSPFAHYNEPTRPTKATTIPVPNRIKWTGGERSRVACAHTPTTMTQKCSPSFTSFSCPWMISLASLSLSSLMDIRVCMPLGKSPNMRKRGGS